ncbi:hypothetical protein [Legionella maceachernii]|uniref:Uncharacterized protein n=1 Tax=Legionella maceachernii TaxID=466 RepID=A0A0W0W5A9_9GAMM|nr:hypothetical protein [Legionella maceachernii]KTD27498.1 hypothetical protein Lmac_1199 [Legionella maceachernii]SKA27089.1 hypothetical protein SAMN02745128_02937 [Legionella maceachernii]SUP04565.1 Uncharacterised protein [Legionella maceachernii]
MRKSQLRRKVDSYLRLDHCGSPRARKHRHFVLYRVIYDLFKIDFVPAKWHGLTRHHILKLIQHWQKQKLKPATIRKYMHTLRNFLLSIEHSIDEIDNKNLGINHQECSKKINIYSSEITQKFSNSIAKLLFELQLEFGVTLSESMRLVPDIHIKENHLWITRNIATNSRDRIIPIRNTKQTKILTNLLALCNNNQDLIGTYNYHFVRCAYHLQLKSLNLSPGKTYRNHYAKTMYSELRKTQSNYLVCQTIMGEMGITSRMTLWRYLYE